MIIGVPKEIKEQEHRVALMPGGVSELAKSHTIVVEAGAGKGIGISDEAYRDAGAQIANTHAEVFEKADLILKVKEPISSEYGLLCKGQVLFTYLHLAANKDLTAALLSSGATAIAYESVEVRGRLPLLEPMSEIAGRMSALVGGAQLGKENGGKGLLLGGVPGVAPGRVVVIGGGTAGVNAARMASGLGAEVTILEVDAERMRFLDMTLPASTVYSSESNLRELLPQTDLLIGAVLVPGARAPKLITREMLRLMTPGSVFVDIAIDQGGCAETSRPTTHANPTYVEEGVVHYCVANMPGAYALTATKALTSATLPFIKSLCSWDASKDLSSLPPALGTGVNIHAGRLTHAAVAESLDLPFHDWKN